MEIQAIKQALRLSEVLSYYGLSPDTNERLRCPFHEDKTPSMQVYEKTDTVYCFSSNCKTHGKSLDVIDFIMHKENTSKHEAILKATSMISGESTKLIPIAIGTDTESTPKASAQSRIATLTSMFSYFISALHNSKPARDYAISRSLEYSKL